MPRYKLILEYLGTNFSGWQKQKNTCSIQETLEIAAYRLLQEKINLVVAGRTDSGVHALGQVFHFDYNEKLDCKKVLLGINHFLKKKNISILSIVLVNEDFDSRRDAKLRTYKYKILNRIASPAILENQIWHISKILDFEQMYKASKLFLGSHDFTTFRASSCTATSPHREIKLSDLKKINDEIIYTVKSRSFLQHQVRSMVGAIKAVGENKWTLEHLDEAFRSKDRNKCAPPAPACGLYLESIEY